MKISKKNSPTIRLIVHIDKVMTECEILFNEIGKYCTFEQI